MNPPKMPVHIGDLLRDTGHCRALLMGAYLLLLFHHWSTGSLPDDDAQLTAIARLTPGEWKKARPILVKFFDEGWHHGRVEEDLASARESYEARAKAGKKGGKAKAEAKQNPSNATAGPEQPFTLDQIPKTKEEKQEPRAKRAASSDDEALFESQFWVFYPNKVGKQDALKAFLKARKRGVEVQTIVAGMQRYIREKPPDRNWMNPATFLNGDRFDDQPASANLRTNSPAGPAPTGDDAVVTGMARALERRRAARGANDPGRQEFRAGGGDGAAAGNAAEPGTAAGDGGPHRQLALLPGGNGRE
jgi:uncharacterized protein YdaU (DUF1376 family)